jgi:cyclophilin family peptidyl-prolyl cis-trans isomerase
MHRVSIALLLAGLSLSYVALAQETKTTAKPSTTAAATGSLTDLLKKRADFRAAMAKFEEEFPQAEPKRQAEIQKIARATVTDYLTKTLPALGKAAVAEYQKDPENEKAEDAVLEYLSQSTAMNKFMDVYTTTTTLIKSGRKHPALYAMNGMARFAMNDFAGAKSVLTSAKTLDEEGLPPDAQQYLDVADKYAKFYEEEKAIRAAEAKADDLPRISLKTSKGEIVVELFENEAPNAVANFISLTEKKFYDGVKFHRVLGNFMAQVGDPNSKDADPSNDGSGGPGYRIGCECYQKTARRHFQGSLSMAHAGKDTGGSQFFITHRPTPHLDPGNTHPATGEPLNCHTVFGRVIKGMEIALAIQPGDTLQTATVVRKRNHAYKPKTMAEKAAPPE